MNRKLLKNNLLLGIVVVFFLGTFNDVIAQNYNWVGGTSSDFSTFENWSPVPSLLLLLIFLLLLLQGIMTIRL